MRSNNKSGNVMEISRVLLFLFLLPSFQPSSWSPPATPLIIIWKKRPDHLPGKTRLDLLQFLLSFALIGGGGGAPQTEMTDGGQPWSEEPFSPLLLSLLFTLSPCESLP